MLRVDNLVLESTRRCNMNCRHCLRGEPQNKDMPITYFPNIFRGLDIFLLTITGGEICLYPKYFNALKNYLCAGRIAVDAFYMKTNGLIRSKSLVSLCDYLASYSGDVGACALALSMDVYHSKITPETLGWWYQVRDYRSWVYFDNSKYTKESLIREGRAANIKEARDIRTKLRNISWEWADKDTLDAMVYVNALGDVTLHCDLSYATQSKLVLGNVRNRTLESILRDPKTTNYVLRVKKAANDWCIKNNIR